MLKTLAREIRKIKARQDALQTTFSVFLDIFYPPNSGYLEENELFQHPRLDYNSLRTVRSFKG